MSYQSSIRIFHIGDFHLDSPLSGLDVRTSDIRRAEHREVFVSALKRAVEEKCDVVLISGDLFDCGYVSGETVDIVFDALKKCPLPIVISPGNHDPYTPTGIYAKKSLPENVYVFASEEMGRFDLDEIGVSVHGYAFTSNRYLRNPLSDGYTLKEGYINLLCAHSELDEIIPKFAPINRSQLENSGFAYVALGHVHKHSDAQVTGKTTYSYSGFAVGRSFDELGFGRGLIVTVDRESELASVEPVTLSDKRYVIEKLDINGAEQSVEVATRIAAFVKEKGYGKETSLRIVLGGAVAPTLKLPTLSASDLGLALLQIEDNTLPIFAAEYLENDISLRGALYRQLLPKMRSDDENERKVAAEALRIGLCALEGKSFL